ncbi:MAG: hypothetical protein OEW90_05005 [Betaproteobacteria bacterium]|nr:hypothetical protein [Betaproteobacteria bacterium]MDH4323478.1 hypothetical protein [Betaproteobacteria bacterium]
MITLEQYFRKPHTLQHAANAADVLERRNRLRAEWSAATGKACEIDPDTGSEISGSAGGDGDGSFRTPGTRTGAPLSPHRDARAVDDYDPRNEFDTWLDQFDTPNGGNSKLAEYGLYREHPSVTPGWCHLTTRAPGSGKRTFYP